jgi:hypothetical protein
MPEVLHIGVRYQIEEAIKFQVDHDALDQTTFDIHYSCRGDYSSSSSFITSSV